LYKEKEREEVKADFWKKTQVGTKRGVGLRVMESEEREHRANK